MLSLHSPKGLSRIERFRDVMSDPLNEFIERVPMAGNVVDGNVIMHNGIKVGKRSYCGNFSDIFVLNKGVHEPQMEYVFGKVLKDIPAGGTMLELGANWSFYSMWFNKEVNRARSFMVEPMPKLLNIGKKHFSLNSMSGKFIRTKVGKGWDIGTFMRNNGIKFLDILHSDIQGAERDMLLGSVGAVVDGRIKYIFIETHSQKLHLWCKDFLSKGGFEIIAFADYDNDTYCFGGVLVGKLKGLEGIKSVDVGSRVKTGVMGWNEFYSICEERMGLDWLEAQR